MSKVFLNQHYLNYMSDTAQRLTLYSGPPDRHNWHPLISRWEKKTLNKFSRFIPVITFYWPIFQYFPLNINPNNVGLHWYVVRYDPCIGPMCTAPLWHFIRQVTAHYTLNKILILPPSLLCSSLDPVTCQPVESQSEWRYSITLAVRVRVTPCAITEMFSPLAFHRIFWLIFRRFYSVASSWWLYLKYIIHRGIPRLIYFTGSDWELHMTATTFFIQSCWEFPLPRAKCKELQV